MLLVTALLRSCARRSFSLTSAPVGPVGAAVGAVAPARGWPVEVSLPGAVIGGVGGPGGFLVGGAGEGGAVEPGGALVEPDGGEVP